MHKENCECGLVGEIHERAQNLAVLSMVCELVGRVPNIFEMGIALGLTKKMQSEMSIDDWQDAVLVRLSDVNNAIAKVLQTRGE